ncbi:hypothetical protein [Psychrobacillus phage Perkons]|nr:hypothetical protein [Psychrobacillus phage Perkons]
MIFIDSKIVETFNIVDLGINEHDYETELELANDINESFQDWMYNKIDAGWEFEE